MKSGSGIGWEDGLNQISQYYRKHLQKAKNSEDPVRLAQRHADDARIFFDCLFEGIDLAGPLSILDIGCGPGNVIAYLQSRNDTCPIKQYTGIDLLPEFIDEAYMRFVEKPVKFLCGNFLDMPPEAFGKMRLVLACGVLVHHVPDYEKYVEAFIQHMMRVDADIIAFNLITEVDADSMNYDIPPVIGKPRAIDRKALDNILSGLKHCRIRCSSYRLYPDATDTFVQIIRE